MLPSGMSGRHVSLDRGTGGVIDIGHDRQGSVNPDNIITIGPLALALDRLVALGLILAFLAMLDWIVRRYRVKARQPAVLAALAGLLAARAAHVWTYRASYALEPVAILQVWLGGWDWRAGVAAAALVLAFTLRQPRPLAAALAGLGVLTLLWLAFLGMGAGQPAMRLPQGLVLTGVHPEAGQAPTWSIGQLRGRPLVINLWASWCPPCRREMPILIAAASDEARATILLVNQGEPPTKVADFLRAEGLDPAHVALDPDGLVGEMARAGALPTTLFIDRDGTVRQVHIGVLTRVQIDIAIRALE